MKTSAWLDTETRRKLERLGLRVEDFDATATPARDEDLTAFERLCSTPIEKKHFTEFIIKEIPYNKSKPARLTQPDTRWPVSDPLKATAHFATDSDRYRWKQVSSGLRETDFGFSPRTRTGWDDLETRAWRKAQRAEANWPFTDKVDRKKENLNNSYLIKNNESKINEEERFPRPSRFETPQTLRLVDGRIISLTGDLPHDAAGLLRDYPTYPLSGIARPRNLTISSLTGLSEDMNPFWYHGTQDSRVVATALAIVKNPLFVEAEARALNVGIMTDAYKAAKTRYDTVVADELARAMSFRSSSLGLYSILEQHQSSSIRDHIQALDEQINRVNFCPAQVKGIIATGKVRDAYVDRVAARAERLEKLV